MLCFFPLDVLDEIRDLIESVSVRFLTYSYITDLNYLVVALLSAFLRRLDDRERERDVYPEHYHRPRRLFKRRSSFPVPTSEKKRKKTVSSSVVVRLRNINIFLCKRENKHFV